MSEGLAPPRIEEAELPGGRPLLVVRDDELPGGTKRRVLPALLAAAPEDEFVYAGPAYGYAQVALAYSAADAGKRSTFFLAERAELHPLSVEARAAGCQLVQVPAGRLSVVQARARAYATAVGARFLPLGFDVPEFIKGLASEALRLEVEPREVWCVAGSGSLSRALQRAWPWASHRAVRIGLPPDPGAAELRQAPEPFAEPAEQLPPFPSCANYDAKAWRFLCAEASPGALFWNVAS